MKAANDNEVLTSERIANAAAIIAECIELDGPVYMPLFKRLMQEYRAAKEDEDALVAVQMLSKRQIAAGGLKAIR